MKIKQLFAASALAVAATGAHAIPTFTTPDGVLDPFGGIDWAQAGSAMTVGPIVNGGAITTYYMANAVSISRQGGGIFQTPGLFPPNNPGTWELTAYAVFNETVSCAGAIGDPCGTTATFSGASGTWYIFLDTSPNSNLVTGAGITDGTLVMSGSITGGGGTFSLVGSGGLGVFGYNGNITFIDPTYFSSIDGTTAVATLQFGSFTTDWTQPTSFAALGGGTQPITGLLLQADGNQRFFVPEPGSIALLGAALAGIGLAARRRTTKA